MKPETKLALRRWTIRKLRLLLDFLDDRLHAAEVSLREELSGLAPVRVVDSTPPLVGSTPAARSIPKRRRGKTAAEFDLSLASRSMPLRFSR